MIEVIGFSEIEFKIDYIVERVADYGDFSKLFLLNPIHLRAISKPSLFYYVLNYEFAKLLI